MLWKYVKTLETHELIKDFENMVTNKVSGDYIECVKENNGGRPNKRTFYAASGTERVIKSLLSFNKNDRETVWKIWDWNHELLNDKYIPFGIDNFGNLICFYKNDDSVVFIEHETGDIEAVAKSFREFIDNLAD